MNSLKNTCTKNLDQLESNIQTIQNSNIKMDYLKILTMLRKELEPLDIISDVKIMDYRIIKIIHELDYFLINKK